MKLRWRRVLASSRPNEKLGARLFRLLRLANDRGRKARVQGRGRACFDKSVCIPHHMHHMLFDGLEEDHARVRLPTCSILPLGEWRDEEVDAADRTDPI